MLKVKKVKVKKERRGGAREGAGRPADKPKYNMGLYLYEKEVDYHGGVEEVRKILAGLWEGYCGVPVGSRYYKEKIL